MPVEARSRVADEFLAGYLDACAKLIIRVENARNAKGLGKDKLTVRMVLKVR